MWWMTEAVRLVGGSMKRPDADFKFLLPFREKRIKLQNKA